METKLPCSQYPLVVPILSQIILSTPSYPIIQKNFNIILSCDLHVVLISGLFPSRFSNKILYAFIMSKIYLLQIIWNNELESLSSG